MPLPPTPKLQRPPPPTELYGGPDATHIGTCWRKCPSHFFKWGLGDPHGNSLGCQVEPYPRLGILSYLEPCLVLGGSAGSPPIHSHMHTHTHR